MRRIDMIGKRIGRLTVVERAESAASGHSRYVCRCDCGTVTTVYQESLRSEKTKSCGCLIKQMLAEGIHVAHRMSKSREYGIWNDIHRRCKSSDRKDFMSYGGRGISVCERWHSFENFYADMGPSNGLTIDRIDANGNYEPNNCRWADLKTQARNRRNLHLLTFNGETKCLAAWAEESGLKYHTLKRRIYLGWSVVRSLTEGVTR